MYSFNSSFVDSDFVNVSIENTGNNTENNISMNVSNNVCSKSCPKQETNFQTEEPTVNNPVPKQETNFQTEEHAVDNPVPKYENHEKFVEEMKSLDEMLRIRQEAERRERQEGVERRKKDYMQKQLEEKARRILQNFNTTGYENSQSQSNNMNNQNPSFKPQNIPNVFKNREKTGKIMQNFNTTGYENRQSQSNNVNNQNNPSFRPQNIPNIFAKNQESTRHADIDYCQILIDAFIRKYNIQDFEERSQIAGFVRNNLRELEQRIVSEIEDFRYMKQERQNQSRRRNLNIPRNFLNSFYDETKNTEFNQLLDLYRHLCI